MKDKFIEKYARKIILKVSNIFGIMADNCAINIMHLI